MKKRFFKRLSVFAVCAVILLSMACPAFAADFNSELENHVYVGSQTLPVDTFTLSGDRYTATFTSSGFKSNEGEYCAVTYADQVDRLKWYYYEGDALSMGYYVGNPALLDSDLPDIGVGFCFVLNKADKTQCRFICTTAFYNEYVSTSSESGFVISFAVFVEPEGFSIGSLMNDIGGVFASAMNMAVRVADTIIEYPILFLSIVVGLCGIGIAFFNRLKQ